MKVLITGTHFTPAQAVIEVLREDTKVKIVYVGRKSTLEGEKTQSVESQVLPKLGVKFISIVAGRFRRFFSFLTLVSLIKIPIGFVQAFYILVKESPDVVLSFGGYVALPVVVMAWLLNIPIILHEQTLVSGLSNTLSSFFADKIAVSFDHNYLFKKSKIILTGNPVRQELFKNVGELKVSDDIKKFIELSKREKLPLILVTGGNQGSHIINEVVEGGIENLTKNTFVVHQTGDSKFKDFDRLSQIENNRYFVRKWIDAQDWAYILNNTDLAVSRAGANTLTEFSLFSVPVILIPLPGIYKDEQNVNTNYFQRLGLAQKIEQKDLKPDVLVREVKKCLEQIDTLKKEAKNAQGVVIKDAARRLALETKLLGERDE